MTQVLQEMKSGNKGMGVGRINALGCSEKIVIMTGREPQCNPHEKLLFLYHIARQFSVRITIILWKSILYAFNRK